MKRSTVLAFVVVGFIGASAGVMYSTYRDGLPTVARAAEDEVIGKPRPPYTLGATDGSRVSASDFDGEVVLVNFWATWCTPCREEMPMLVEVQEQLADRGLKVIGIALDDVQQARDFADELGVTYTILVGSADVMAAGAVYGNRAGMLPYSVLIDREGIVRWTSLGELKRRELLDEINKLL